VKIAVCYSGGLRTFIKCYEQNHKVLSQLGEIDYYISTWESPCYTKVARFDDVLAVNGYTIYDDMLRPDEIVTEKYLKSFLDFKKIDIESMDRMEEILKPYETLPWHIMSPLRLVSQYYKLKRAFDLVDGDYDLCVRIRPDVVIHQLPKISLDKIYMNHMVYVECAAISTGTINEMLYISNMENMRKMCNIYENFDKLWNIHDAYGERMSYKNLEIEGLLEKVELFDFDLRVIRENGRDEYIR